MFNLCRFSLEILFGSQQGGSIVADVPAFVMLCSLVRPAVSLSTQQIPAALSHSQKTPVSPEQDTGKGFYLVIGNSCAAVVRFLCACHGITSKPFLIEEIALKHRPVSRDEPSSCVLGDLFGGAGVVENDLREHAVRTGVRKITESSVSVFYKK